MIINKAFLIKEVNFKNNSECQLIINIYIFSEEYK